MGHGFGMIFVLKGNNLELAYYAEVRNKEMYLQTYKSSMMELFCEIS